MGKASKLLNEREKILLESAKSYDYKTPEVGDTLSIHFYFPKDLKTGPKRTAVLFFNGGGWDRGNVIQFAPHALHFVERGMVCGLVEYRNSSTHPESSPRDSLVDARAAFQFVRQQSEQLHVDNDKLVGVGAMAGANIVAAAAMQKSRKSPKLGDFAPNAVIMFCPIIDVNRDSFVFERFSSPAEAKEISLSKNIDSGVCPMLVMHGTFDRLVSFSEVKEFVEKMKKKRNQCELTEFEGRDQNFFNFNVDPVSYEASLKLMEDFLVSHHLLEQGNDGDDLRVISWREEDY